MAIGAHADDIEINVGGTVLKYRERGYELVYVMSTNNMSGNWKRFGPNGERYVTNPPYTEMQPQRKLEADTAARFFGTAAIHLDHPQRHYRDAAGQQITVSYGSPRPHVVHDGQHTILTAHEDPRNVQQVADLILEHQPEAVLTHGPVMIDMEHVGTCLLVSKGFLKAQEAGYDGMLLHWLDFTPSTPINLFGRRLNGWDSFVDISEHFEQKIQTVKFHASVVPTPENLEYPQWGAACGCAHAEVFTIPQWGRQPEYTAALAMELMAHSLPPSQRSDVREGMEAWSER
jgi:LmbE family N-acetylglucosaminyl deacetylase